MKMKRRKFNLSQALNVASLINAAPTGTMARRRHFKAPAKITARAGAIQIAT